MWLQRYLASQWISYIQTATINGYVSHVEARSVSAVENQFDLADTNQDGLLDKEEYVGIGNARASC